jgi:hypothetical protein
MANSKISALPAASTPLAGTELVPVVQGGITEQVSVANLTAGRQVDMLYLNISTSAGLVGNVNSTNANGGYLRWQTNSTSIWDIGTTKQVFGTGTANDGGFATRPGYYLGLGANGAESLRLTTTGDVSVLTGNLVVGTSGKGVDFSATAGTGTSELLADYEEGTFTPNLLFGGGNTGMTGSFVGRYTKIGRVVYYTVVIYLSAKGSSTGNTTISGFPYTSSASSTFYEGKIDTDNVTGLAYQPIAQMSTSTTTLNVYINNAGALNNISDASFANNSRFYVTGFYEA